MWPDIKSRSRQKRNNKHTENTLHKLGKRNMAFEQKQILKHTKKSEFVNARINDPRNKIIKKGMRCSWW